jgi:antitoxin ParD1/3/4
MVTVSISPLQVAGIRAAVDEGAYESGSAVVREALRMWDEARKRDDPHGLGPASGKANGTDHPVSDMFANHEAELRRRA